MAADITLDVVISRDLLALAPLDINDNVLYRCTPTLLGGNITWNRQTVTSPYIDGAATVSRTREMVQEQIAVDIWGRTNASPALSNAQLKANMDIVAAAFLQDFFTITVTVDSAVYEYNGEAADYQTIWNGDRFRSKLGQLVFTMPRQPVPVLGVV